MLTDQLWARLEPLIPPPPRRYRFPGRRRTDHRAALEGILFVVRTGGSSRAARSTAATTSA